MSEKQPLYDDSNYGETSKFFGLWIEDFPSQDYPKEYPKKIEPLQNCYRVSSKSYDKDPPWDEIFDKYLDMENSEETNAMCIGVWGETDIDSEIVINAMVASHEKLPNLQGLFIGDISQSENEISWIRHSYLTPVFKAFPKLTEVVIRGSNVNLSGLKHKNLKSLIIQSGGLNGPAVENVLDADLPSLEYLEFWLGDSYYGPVYTSSDFTLLFDCKVLLSVKNLLIRNTEISDEIAIALSKSPLITRLESLDLSLGTLSDKGLIPLLESDNLKNLKKFDIHHHFCSDDAITRLNQYAAKHDIEINSKRGDPNEDEDTHYVAISE